MGLSIKKIEKLTKPGRYHDGRGLYLQVKSSTNRSWVFRFTKEGRERWMGLGPLAVFTLEEARSRARKVHQQLVDGIDPLAEREKEEAERKAAEADLKARAVTFRKAAQEYYDRKHLQWSNLKHRAQFLSTMETYAYPKLGDMVVGSIVRKHVVEVLECDDFWTQKNVTADRVRNRIELVLDYAAARDWREGPNPAKWKGNLALVLPDRNEVKSENHHAALSHEALPAFMVELRAKEGVAARALEFLILCASRTGEVTGAQRTEIDWDKCIWTIPAARMKIRKNGDHRVPLSVEAVALLKLLPEEKGNPFLFIGERKDGLNHNTMTALLGRMGRKDITIHGFRSTFRDWVADNHPLKRELAERALAHSVNSKTEAAYQRSDQLDLRRPMMQDWANFCGGKTASAKVVQFRATKIAAE